jgi:hypothetical protein
MRVEGEKGSEPGRLLEEQTVGEGRVSLRGLREARRTLTIC